MTPWSTLLYGICLGSPSAVQEGVVYSYWVALGTHCCCFEMQGFFLVWFSRIPHPPKISVSFPSLSDQYRDPALLFSLCRGWMSTEITFPVPVHCTTCPHSSRQSCATGAGGKEISSACSPKRWFTYGHVNGYNTCLQQHVFFELKNACCVSIPQLLVI